MNDPDHKMAMLLQKQFEREIQTEVPSNGLVYPEKKKKNKPQTNTDPTKCLIDPSWELVDPTPDVHVLFMAFNSRFFWSKLGSVTVAWSKRMTSCAGVCSFEYRGKECKITLSEPLLKLRPRKDLVETLLHEMIHALLFITNKDRHSRDGHGPEFHNHMYRINNEAGTNITVYHDFHDEVKLYQQHWWRCDGPCQKWKPYFGFVKRSMNRAPAPSDFWWKEHQYRCGGTYIKVKEPEKPIKSRKKSEKIDKENKSKNMGDITKFISITSPKSNTNNTINTFSTVKGAGNFGTKNKNGTVVLNPKTDQKGKLVNKNTSSNTKGNILTINDIKENTLKIDNSNTKDSNKNNSFKPLHNVFTINDIDSANKNSFKKADSPKIALNNASPNIDYSVVRNKWLERFDSKNNDNTIKNKNGSKRKSTSNIMNSPKKTKTETSVSDKTVVENGVNCPVCNKIVSNDELNNHLDQCLLNDNEETANESFEELTDNIIKTTCPVCKKTVEDSLLNDHLDTCLGKNDGLNNKPIKVEPSTSKAFELTQCEICDNFITSKDFDIHMQDCLHNLYDEIEKKYNFSSTKSDFTNCLVCNSSIKRSELEMHLETCMGMAFQGNMHEEFDDKEDDEGSKNEAKKYNCPICMELVEESVINKHIDICLNENNFDLSD